MSWTTSIADLRFQLSDGPEDKYRYRQRCVGSPIDGENTIFKTFDKRRVNNFANPSMVERPAIGVYVSGQKVTPIVDDPEIGEFELQDAPAGGDVVEATYYCQWFNDDELASFLMRGALWLAVGSDVTTIDPGLRDSTLQYAGSLAYQKLSLLWVESNTKIYRLEDQGSDKPIQNPYAELAKAMMKAATDLRDTFYKRQGRPGAPLFGIVRGRVRDEGPKR